MMKRSFLAGLILMMSALSVTAQITEKAEYGKFALLNATIHTVTKGKIERGVVLINGDVIEFVGENAKISADYTPLDYTGKHIYPGLIDAGTLLGLQEISAVPVTVDQSEVGMYNPHVRAFTAINPHSASIPVTRVSGVTTVLAHPTSGRIAGIATVINLWGFVPDSMAVRAEAALHIEWPSAAARGWRENRTPQRIREDFLAQVKGLDDYLATAKAYHQALVAFEADAKGKAKPEKNVKYEALRDVFTGKLPVMITVNREQDILEALKWIKKYPDMKFVLSSVEEGWRVAEKIAEAGVPCLVGPVLRTTSRSYDNYQRPYQNAGLLHKAGVKVAIRTGETENVRNLPYHAGYAATYGLGKHEAMKAITINPAEIFGIADKMGSIEVGKHATLFVADGDALETMTNIEQVFIRGTKIPMESRQTQLFNEFLKRDDVRK